MSKQNQYREIVNKYIQTYGSEFIDKADDKPIVFNITGSYRKKVHEPESHYVQTLAYFAIFAFISWFVSILTSIAVFGALAFVNYANHIDSSTIFDGELIDVEGVQIGVAIPTQTEEGELESKNFVDTSDKKKLTNKLDEAHIVYLENQVVTWSVGSTTSQCIDGHPNAPFSEFEMGVDFSNDTSVTEFLEAHNAIMTHDGVLVIMNSCGYGVEENGGIVYNDNKMEYDTITANVVPRTIGGTGTNQNAMEFIERIARIHRQLDHNYVLAVVPRGDKSMPQGGSHSKQRILEHFLANGEGLVVLEVSGKQTKMFELPNGACNVNDTPEIICKNIKETKIMDANGKSHGSLRVFG